MTAKLVNDFIEEKVPSYLRHSFIYEYEKYSNYDSLDAFYNIDVLETLLEQAEERFNQSG